MQKPAFVSSCTIWGRNPRKTNKYISATLAYIQLSKACTALIPGTRSNPSPHRPTRSPEGRVTVEGWASAGSQPAAWTNGTTIRGRRGFLERCDRIAKGPIKQGREVLTAADAFTWGLKDHFSQGRRKNIYFQLGMKMIKIWAVS